MNNERPITLEHLLPFFASMTMTFDALGQIHHERTALIAGKLAEALACNEDLKRRIRQAALVHDVGKIAIDDSVLFKHGKYTEAERAMMDTHVFKGVEFLRLLANAGVVVEESVISIVAQHHENYNGTGYPYRIRNSKIHLGARILRIADFYEAITSQNRSYRSILKHEDALMLMSKEKQCFDPKMFEVFTKLREGLITDEY